MATKMKASMRKFLFDNTPATKILDVYESSDWRTGEKMTDIVCSCAGDACSYRIYGSTPKTYRIVER